jgi:hypothetical protein
MSFGAAVNLTEGEAKSNLTKVPTDEDEAKDSTDQHIEYDRTPGRGSLPIPTHKNKHSPTNPPWTIHTTGWSHSRQARTIGHPTGLFSAKKGGCCEVP